MRYIPLLLLLIFLSACTKPAYDTSEKFKKGSVIFFHPDGTSLTNWHAMRMLKYGPDKLSNWDRLPNTAVYLGHTKNSLTSSSHGGATIHAYGVKVIRDSYGLDGTTEITAASGKKMSIMEEAMEEGLLTGLVNTGSVIEPGTGCFVASSEARRNYEEITEKIVKSGVDFMLSGGEEWMLPEGVQGRFSVGKRTDGENLIEWAKAEGYNVIYTRDELLAIDGSEEKVLGVFCEHNTFNDQTEEELLIENKPLYKEGTPTIAEMMDAALRFFDAKGRRFFLVAEEEATDNFANNNNAPGTIEALKRSDDAIKVARDYIGTNPLTMLIMAADSEAGGFEIMGLPKHLMDPEKELPLKMENGAPADGVDGPGSKPFIALPDNFGNELPFLISWSTLHDVSGAVLAKGAGLNSDLVKGTIDNTEIYKFMYATLFGNFPGKQKSTE
ncbi:MAG: alkaline phosphatase [Melioribacteraceae bacterium]|nr:MAG: alkaline phosphatase [Melioribacteraceae bacterium]